MEIDPSLNPDYPSSSFVELTPTPEPKKKADPIGPAVGYERSLSDAFPNVCFYQESRPNRSRAGGCTERYPFPYS